MVSASTVPIVGRDRELAAIAEVVEVGGALCLCGPAGIGKTALLPAGALRITGCQSERRIPLGALHRTQSAPGTTVTVDDAQWLDPASYDVLTFAARRLTGTGVAMLIATRGSPPVGIPSLTLGPLDRSDSYHVLTAHAPGPLEPDVAAVLIGRAEGNPGALVGLAQSLTLAQCRGEAEPPATLAPETALRQAYANQLNGLPPPTRWLLLLAATGQPIEVAELVGAAAASGHHERDLAPAERAGLVAVDDHAVRFPPPLLASVVYAEATLADRYAAHRTLARVLPPSLRRDLHRAAVSGRPNDPLAAELARAAGEERTDHLIAAQALERAAELTADPADAAAYRVRAARRAWRAGRPHQARILLQRVRAEPTQDHIVAERELLLGEIELRAGIATNARNTLLAAATKLAGRDRRLSIGAYMLAGEAMCDAGDHASFAAVAAQALQLRRPDDPIEAQLLFEHFTGLSAAFAGEPRRAERSLRRVLALAPRLDDAVALVRAGLAGILLGDDGEAHRLATRAATVARARGDLLTVPHALEVAASADLALGGFDAATSSALDGLRLARTSGQINIANNHLGLLAVLAGMLGDRAGCGIRVRESRAHPGADQDSLAWNLGEWALSLLELVAGRHKAAAARLRATMRTEIGRGHLLVQIPAMPTLVEAAARCGERALAAEALRVYDVWATSTANPTWLALSSRCHALLAAGDGEAEERFTEALGLHLIGDSEFARARTELLFGQELRRRRKPAAAREHLRSALETFEQFGAVPWVELAQAELRAAGEHVEPAKVEPGTALTAQQLRIAELVGAGATNREIAAALFISPRTVDHHLRNIFTRLGVRSRTELARLL